MTKAEVGESDDLATLSDLDEASLLSELKARYNKNQIYTYIGDILVAVNPYKDLGLYGKEYSEKYKHGKRTNNPPHIFAVSDAAYQSLLTGNAIGGKKNQCIVISGESGAGKTESTKFIIKQLIELCKGKSQLEQQILQVNPLLEAFGNAQTMMNDNSSRFGKYIQLKFQDGRVKGAKISEYLLEKSRVTFQNPNEETFHIFYYMFGGLPTDTKAMLNLLPPDKYKYLKNGAGRLKTNPEGTMRSYEELIDALNLVGFYEEEQEDMFTTLAAVLWMGQIEIDTNEEDAAFIKNTDALQITADLLGVDAEQLKCMITFVTSRARGEVFTRNYTKQQAYDVRDALTKTLYGRLFSWIVNKVNQLLAPEEELDPSIICEIGILDIFGFEHLYVNSFEQMCINLANEQLQNFFNQHIFLLEQAEYQVEGVDWTRVPFVNNQPLLDLFLLKPIGVLALLDEESLFPQGSDHSFVEKMDTNFAKNHHYIKAKVSTSNKFSIDHYAGRVEYDGSDFLEKNRDTLPFGAVQLFKSSTTELINTIFSGTITRTGTLALQNRINPNRKSRKSLKKMQKGRNQPAKKLTVGAQFKNSLSVLMELLNLSNPHFVRCIKPNPDKKPNRFNDKQVTAQLRYTGMLETTRIRKEGYAVRPKFADFVKRYKVITLNPKLSENQYGCKKILEVSGIQGWMLGKTKVFLKYFHQDELEEKIILLGKKAVHVQKIVRGFLARRLFSRMLAKYRKEVETCNTFLKQVARLSLQQQQLLFALQQKDKSMPQAFFDLMAKSNGVMVKYDANNPPLPEPEPERDPPKVPNITQPDETEALTMIEEQNGDTVETSETQEGGQDDEKEDDEDEDEDDEEEEDVIEEDIFVKQKKKTMRNLQSDEKYEASKRWFQETQYKALKGSSGIFKTWFHGIITRRQSEELLWNKPEGSFIVRVSESRFGYSVSLRAKERCKHFAVDQLRNKRYVVVGEEKTFPSLNELVKYYRINPVSPYGDKLLEPVGQEEENECDYEDLIKDLPPTAVEEPEPKPDRNSLAVPSSAQNNNKIDNQNEKLPPPPADWDDFYLAPKEVLSPNPTQPPPLPPKTRIYHN